MKRVVVRGGQKILGTLASGIGDSILTKDSTTNELGSISPIDPSTYLTTTLSDGSIIIGNSSNVATPRSLTGAMLITNLGLTSISPDVITNSNIFSGAGIQYSKLNLTNSIVNNDIATLANINRSKLATGTPYRMVVNDSTGRLMDANSITAGRVLISDLNGLPTDSGLTSTTLSYIDVSSSIQTQLDNRLFFSNSITPVEGDLIVFQSGTWNRFAKGSSGQYLSSTVGGLQWVTTPNGLPVGGSTNDYLRKNSSTDYDTVWDVLNVAKIVDITATAAQINVLATGYYDVTSSIQTQLSNKLNNALSNNAIFVGNNVNQPGQLAAGSNGQVLTVVAGVPQWQTISGTGTVTSVAFSGGSTGLSVTGSPITTSGTITLTGTINPTHGGTGLVTYTTGDLLYASASNVLSSLAVGTSGYVLTVSGGIPTWQANAGASVLTTKGDLFTYDTGNQRLPIGTDGYILTADSGQATGMKWALPISEPFTDNIAIIKNNADNTKLVKFDASIISTATTRTYTLPDFSGTVALLGSTNGAALSKVDDTNVTITLSGNPNTALLAATTITLGWTGTLADGRIASSSNWNTAYDRSGTSLGFTSSTFTFTKQDASTLTIAVPTFNQNTTGSAAKWTTARNLAGNSVDGSANVAFANTFIVQGTTDSGLSGAQFLGSLATGIVKNTTTTGVLSIAVAGDFPTLNQNTTGSAGSVINALTVDDSSIQLSSGTTYDGSAAKTISVKALGITNSLIANSTIDLTAKVTGVLPVANGGTNISSYAIGDIIYASGATTLSKLADVAVGSYLRSGGVTTAPVWSTVTLPNSTTTGDLIYASGTNTYSNLAVGGATTVLHGGTTPSYSAVSLTADVSGILPIANGGTGASGGAFLLASGGIASGANTFTHNTAGWMTFSGTWSASANNQISRQFTDALTLRGTASDVVTANYFNPTLTLASTTQNPVGLNLDVTYIQQGGISTTIAPSSTTLAGMTATTYTNVAPASTSGSGTGALFTVVVGSATSITSITQTTAGSGYKANETITFNGSQFGSGSGSTVYTIRAVSGVSVGTTASAMRVGISGWNANDNPKLIDCYYQGTYKGGFGIAITSGLTFSSNLSVFDDAGTANIILNNSSGLLIQKGIVFQGSSGFTGVNAPSTFSALGTLSFNNNLGGSTVTTFSITNTSTVTSPIQSNSFVSRYKSTGSVGTFGLAATVSLTAGGTGYTTGTKTTTGGTGSGATITINTVSGGVITAISTTPVSKGTGYSVNDVLTLVGGTAGTVTVTAVDYAGTIIAFDDAGATFTDASSNNKYYSFVARPTYNVTSTQTGTIGGFLFNPTLTATGSFNVNGIVIVPTGTTNGIGTGSPTATLDIRGAGSNPTLKTVGAGTGTNYSYRAFQSDGTTEIYSLLDNGLFINTNTVNGSTITSTWTATANNQFMGRFTGTATTENVNSDVIIGYQFDPNFTRNASNPTTQSAYSVYIKQPTISNGAFATAASLLLQGGGTNALPALVLGNSSFTSPLNVYQSANSTVKFDIGTTAVFSISNLGIGFGSLSPTSGFNIIGSSVIAVNSGTASGTTDVAFNLRRTGFGGNSGVGSYLPITFTNRYTTGLWTDASIRHVVYDNGSATATDGYEFYNHQSQDASTAVQLAMVIKGNLVGIGTGTSPTSKLELGGNISAASWTTTGIQMAFDAATYTDTGTAGTRATGVAIGVARPTYASTNAVTVTDAATVYIANDVAAGTNTTLTRTHALWVAAGISRFDGKVQVGSGVSADGGGLKHARVTTGSIAGGSTGLVTVTWTTAFADANYTVTADVIDSTTSSLSLSVVHIESVSASTVTVRVLNNSVGALTGTLNVIAIHD